MVDDLPLGYYRDNFLYLIDFVRAHYDDVLSPTEKAYHDQFNRLSLDAQRLYVRLISRKGPFLRSDKLEYAEIENTPAVLSDLESREFIIRNSDAANEVWLQMATKTELVKHFSVQQKSRRKEALCAEIAASVLPEEVKQTLPFDLVEPLFLDELAVFRLLFFGNLYQDLTDFVLRDLGITPFESYPLDPAGRYFDRRELVQSMLAAYRLQDQAYAVMESPEHSLAEFAADYLVDLKSTDPQLQQRHSKILNRVARQLERESEPTLALSLYQGSRLVPARERQVRLLAGQGTAEAALQLCREICETATDEAEFEFAVTFANRLIRQQGLSQEGLSQQGIPDREQDHFQVDTYSLPYVPNQRVEVTTAEWLQEGLPGAQVAYVENGLLPGLFGLFFWDIIFYPVRGAFFNPLQRGPADLFTEQFCQSRHELIEARLEELTDIERARDRMLQTFAEKYGIANHFIMWRLLSTELISLALQRIPATHLAVIFRRLLRDLKNNRSGFPDLVCFPLDAGYEMVEIKGPGDSLQANQKRWLRFFHRHQIPARVVNVIWQD